jgi:hypothetical protein
LTQDYYRQIRLKENVEQLAIAYQEEKLRLQERNQEALLLSQGQGETTRGASEGPFEEGLPKKDTGIGAKEAEIGKNLGIKDSKDKGETKREEPATTEDLAKQRRDEDREAARKRREDFGESWPLLSSWTAPSLNFSLVSSARNAPPTGNPSDSFQPEAWSPSGGPARRR